MSMSILYHEGNPQEVYTEAYGWLVDSVEEVPEYMSYAECEGAMNRHYEGGWAAFVKSCGAFLV